MTIWHRLGAVLALLAGMMTEAAAHPGHDSVTQAVYRRESGLLEVTVSVHSADLEKALSQRMGRKVAIEPAENEAVDQQILKYLQDRFLIETAEGRLLEFVWVGRELGESSTHHADGELVLLHVEATLKGGLEHLRVRQGLFCEFNDDQINLVHLRDDDRKLTLGFSPQHEAKTVLFKPAE